MIDEIVQLKILIPEELKKQFKLKCIEDDITIQDRIIELIQYDLQEKELQRGEVKLSEMEDQNDY